jgi:hypothetical protein
LFLEEDAGHSHGIHLKSVSLQHAGDLDGDRLGKLWDIASLTPTQQRTS